MKKWLVNAGLLCLFAALCLSAQASTATFQIITDPITGTWANFAVSGDGTVMAANYGGEIYRWTAADGFQDLGPGDPYNSSIAISRDGSTIISGRIGADGFSSPTIWNKHGVIDLGHPSNGCTAIGNSWGSGYGVSATGRVAVGLAWTCREAEGFSWTAKDGMLNLGHPSGHHSSRASAVSANAKTIVGFWEDPTGPRRPVRWVDGKHDLFLGPSAIGEASAVNSNGTKIVGQAPGDTGYGVAFIYSDKKGLQSLGTIQGGPTDQSFANAISDNGTVIGWSGDPFGEGIEAFVWTAQDGQNGMSRLADWLTQAGAKIPKGTTLSTAIAISADGSTIIGEYYDTNFNYGNWVAHITK